MKKEVRTLHFILAGLLLNGYVQGRMNKELDYGVLELAKKEIKNLTN